MENYSLKTVILKKYVHKIVLIALIFTFLIPVSTFAEDEEDREDPAAAIMAEKEENGLLYYTGSFWKEDLKVVANFSSKTYMDWRSITSKSSKQYWFIKDYMYVDETSGLLYDEYGFIGAALGSYYGEIGDRFLFHLEGGNILPIVKAEEKANSDTDDSGAYQKDDYSIIEFLIDKRYACDYFGVKGNGYILWGNFNNCDLFKGKIEKIEKMILLNEDTEILDIRYTDEELEELDALFQQKQNMINNQFENAE